MSTLSSARRLARLPTLAVVVGCTALAACESRTNVSATGNAPAQFTHVFLTVNQIWFNTSASALQNDPSWVKFALSAPETVDLANLDDGKLSQFASELKLAAGS
jgi:hypothetical protein